MVLELSEIFGEPPRPLSPPPFPDSNPSRMGAGLENLGNTCFLNSVLQCFTHTVQLVQSLRSLDHATPCRGEDEGGFCVLCAVREHVEDSLASSGGVVSPWKLVENLNHFCSSFQRYQQEDAHEFLQCLLDRLCSCVEFSLQDKPSSSLNNSFIKQIFGGRLRSRLKCCNCGHCSDTFEPLIDLSLEIEGVDTLSTSLESFTKVEKIGDVEEKFTCGNCKEEVVAEKQLKIDQAPAVSVLHLKRFKSDGLYVEKINEFVKFPLELDLQPFISDPSGDYNGGLKYDLYAVLVHIGISSDSGHYFCYIRSSPDSWHRLDDSKVVRVSEDDVLKQEAYILFYKRQGSPWFLNLMETQKTCLECSNASTSPRSVLDGTESAAVPSLSGDGSSGSEGDEDIDAPSAPPPKSSSPYILPKEPTGSWRCCETSEGDESINAPSTPPPRSSSPDMLPKEPTASEPTSEVLKDGRGKKSLSRLLSTRHALVDVGYQNPEVHLSQEELKRPPSKVLEDGRVKQSLNRLLRGMPNSRSTQLLPYISPQSEGSMNRTKKRRVSPPSDIPHSREEAFRTPPPSRWNIHKAVTQSLASGGDSNLVLQFDSI